MFLCDSEGVTYTHDGDILDGVGGTTEKLGCRLF